MSSTPAVPPFTDHAHDTAARPADPGAPAGDGGAPAGEAATRSNGTTRRDFVARGAATVLGVAALPALPAFAGASRAPAVWTRRDDHDLVIRGGIVHDGSGGVGREADVAVRGDRIVSVEPRVRDKGRREIDARGLVVAPGFIDIHSHGEGNLWDDPRAESVVRQGVTTIVGGQDGSSRAWGEGAGGAPGADSGSFVSWFAAVDALQPSVNVATMIGLGTVRGKVVGDDDRAATPDEVARMTACVARALADGACGASSGLEYTPGAFARLDELIAVSRPLAARRLPYATHMRNEDDRLLDAIDESIAVARGAGCPLQIAHLKTQGPRNWSKLDTVFARLEREKAAGLDVAFDRYPYIAYQTGLTNLFPVWSRDGGAQGFLRRLDDPATAARIKSETLGKVDLIGGWDNVLVASVRAAEDRAAEGKRLGAYARSLGREPYDVTVALLRRNALSVGMVGFAMSEENLDRILAHPMGMVCSDGGAYAVDGPTRRGSPHPRGLGSFPRVLGRYVRERKALTLEQAIRKMSALPASRLGLTDRGMIRNGLAADLVVFDPATVADRATYEQPFQYPVGIAAVVVNGGVALEREERGAGRGKGLRSRAG
ncbi:MAG: D-aminoacylase [Gemmatimonadaceae bacterium]|nr:D-aminoacylase [Gemmatimonadaceae bacterium]